MQRILSAVLVSTTFFLADAASSSQLELHPPADLAASLDAYFAPLAAAGEFGGVVLVGTADSVLALRTYGLTDHERGTPMTPDTRFRIASLTKSFTAAAVLVLADRRVLGLDDPLERWIAGFPRGSRITIRHLLGHESGVGEPEHVDDVADIDGLVEAIANASPLFEPGAESRYSNAGYALLARVVERASGMDFDDFLAATFFRPLAMTGTGGYGHRQDVAGAASGYLPGPPPAGVVRAPRPHSRAAIGSGHLWSTAPDLWRWARAVDAGTIFDVDAGDWPYGWGKIRDVGREGVQQTGLTDGYTASLAVHRASDTYVVVLGNVMNAGWTRWAGDASRIAFGETASPILPPAAAPIDPARLRAYVGTYDPAVSGPPPVEVVIREGHAWLQWEGQPPGFYLSPVSDSEFVVRGECGRVRFFEGAAGELRWNCGDGVTLFRLRGASEGAADTLLIRNVHVVPMTRDTVLRDHSIRIVGGVIERIGGTREIAGGPAVPVVDGAGGYLVPGLVDAHVHLNDEGELRSYLAHGVTTVVNMRGWPAHRELAQSVADGETLGPSIVTSGPLIDGDPPIWDPPGTTVVTSPAEARAAVASQEEAGYDLVKVYNNVDPASLAAAVEEAEAHGLVVVGHIPRNPDRSTALQKALDAGLAMIAHGEEIFFTYLGGAGDVSGGPLEPVDLEQIRAAAQLVADAGAAVTPTLSFIAMTRRMLEDLESVLEHPESRFLSPDVRETWRQHNPTRRDDLERFAARETIKMPAVRTLTLELQRAGVLLLLGTDASAPGMHPGWSALLELEELAAAGLTSFEALSAGTRNAGSWLERNVPDARRVGTVEIGKAADLVLVAGNPLEDVSAMRGIRGVVVGGRWIPRAELDGMREQ